METPELSGPLLREGKVEPGSVPNARHPVPGSSADKSKCNSIPSPSPHAPAYQMASGRRLLQPRGAQASLGPQLWDVCHQPQGEDTRPGPQGGRGVVAPLALAALPALSLSSLLTEGLTHDHGRRPLGLQTLPGPRHCGRADPGWGVPPRSAKLGPTGVRRERWVRRCEGVSAPVMGAHSLVILFAGRWQRGFRWDSLLFPKAFWRIRYKRLKCTFTLSVFGIY